MTRRVITTAAFGALVALTACGGGSDDATTDTNPANDPSATFATVPTVEDPADTAAATTAPPSTGPGTTIPLQPSGDIDLPTQTPEEIAAGPSTTVATGPLPLPSIGITEVARFEAPVELTARPGDPRNFVVEQGGRILAFDDLSTEVVLDVSDLTAASGEQGLLGVAFDPTADRAYVHYSDGDGNTVLDEYEIDPVTAVFDTRSRREVLTVEQPYANHNGGEVTFGPDGYLYLGLGDGGSANDPERNALSLATPLGKILRIDPQATADAPYAIPPDNPFVDVAGADPAIWSLGLRNPWKFSFDTLTGDLWIADVGQTAIEEINLAPAVNGRNAGKGLSFGWSAFEGTTRFHPDQDPDDHTDPVVEYAHGDDGCSVSGGAVARSEAVPSLVGWYVYGDFCSGRIWAFDPTSPPDAPVVVQLAELANLTAIAVGGEGDLFAVGLGGSVLRFTEA